MTVARESLLFASSNWQEELNEEAPHSNAERDHPARIHSSQPVDRRFHVLRTYIDPPDNHNVFESSNHKRFCGWPAAPRYFRTGASCGSTAPFTDTVPSALCAALWHVSVHVFVARL